VVTAKVDTVECYCVVVEFIVFTVKAGIVQSYCVVCGVYCGYSNSCYSAILLCSVWSLLWVEQR